MRSAALNRQQERSRVEARSASAITLRLLATVSGGHTRQLPQTAGPGLSQGSTLKWL